MTSESVNEAGRVDFDPVSITNWRFVRGKPPKLGPHIGHASAVWLLGRYGDIFGPVPAEMINPDAWRGGLLHAAHDLIAYAADTRTWRDIFPHAGEVVTIAPPLTFAEEIPHAD